MHGYFNQHLSSFFMLDGGMQGLKPPNCLFTITMMMIEQQQFVTSSLSYYYDLLLSIDACVSHLLLCVCTFSHLLLAVQFDHKFHMTHSYLTDILLSLLKTSLTIKPVVIVSLCKQILQTVGFDKVSLFERHLLQKFSV